MSEFNDAYRIISNNEGGYCKIKGDRGGETYCGITRKNFPNWAGWPTIDEHEIQNGYILPDLAPLVKNFYYANFWLPIKGDALDSQHVANFVFDWYVNSGAHAIKALQKLAGVKADGVIGDMTIHAVNACNEDALLHKLKDARIDFYNAIVDNDKTQKKFIKGWLARVERLA